MRWRRWGDYEPRLPRPAVTKLNPDQLADLARKLNAAVSRSPVLAGLGVRVRAERGRFYVERVGGEPKADAPDAGEQTRWAAYTIRPNASDTIAAAEAWLIKRKWKPWT